MKVITDRQLQSRHSHLPRSWGSPKEQAACRRLSCLWAACLCVVIVALSRSTHSVGRLYARVVVSVESFAPGAGEDDASGSRLQDLLVQPFDPGSLQASSFQCSGEAREEHRVCFFRNVFLYRGSLFFYSPGPDPPPVLPRVRTAYFQNVGEELRWLQPVAVTPASLPFGGETQPQGMVRLTDADTDVYLWSSILVDNYGHALAEALPSLHNTLCKYLKRCTVASRRGLVLYELFGEPVEVPSWGKELLACYSDHRRQHAKAPELADTVVLMRSAVVGIGPDCRARYWCSDKKQTGDLNASFDSISAEQMAAFQARLGQCFDYNPQALAPLAPPQILLINREPSKSSGRSILNADELLEGLQRRYRQFAQVRLVYTEEMTVRQQAHTFNGHSLIIHMHGATLGNWMFLPRSAVAVQMSHLWLLGPHDKGYADDQARDLRGTTNVSWFPLTNRNMSLVRFRENVYSDPDWRLLSEEERAEITERGNCTLATLNHPGLRCDLPWLLKGSDFVVDVDWVARVVDTALAELYAKQSRPVPPALAGLLAEEQRRIEQLNEQRRLERKAARQRERQRQRQREAALRRQQKLGQALPPAQQQQG